MELSPSPWPKAVNESGREFVNPEKKDRIYMMQYIIFVELGRAGKGPLVGWRFKKSPTEKNDEILRMRDRKPARKSR